MERLQQETAADAPEGTDQSRHKLQKKLDGLSQTQRYKEVSWVQVGHRKQKEEAHPGKQCSLYEDYQENLCHECNERPGPMKQKWSAVPDAVGS